MVRVYLPIDNNNINNYFNTKKASKNNDLLIREELERILSLSLGNEYNGSYEVVYENRSTGQYIIIETEREKKWVTISADYTRIPGDGGSNNAYFVQFIPMTIADYYLNQTEKTKSMELYLKGTNHRRSRTRGQQIYYKLAKTVGIKILNEFEFDTEIRRNIANPFTSIDEWRRARNGLSSTNRGNKPSYVIENENSYTFYGKTFGANGRESIFILYVLANIAAKENKKIYLYEVTDNGTFAFESSTNEENQKFKRVLKDLNVVYYADSITYVENEEYEDLSEPNKDSRSQAEFMRNLLYKYNCKRDDNGDVVFDSNGKPIIVDDIKRCYLCHCDIQNMIIASHIHRVCDINKLNIPFREKRAMAVDGDNGFWLCANHDKLFEYGFIYFKGNKMIISEKLNEVQKEFVKSITFKTNIDVINKNINYVAEESVQYSYMDEFCITDKDYNDKMHNYLEIHRNRFANE